MMAVDLEEKRGGGDASPFVAVNAGNWGQRTFPLQDGPTNSAAEITDTLPQPVVAVGPCGPHVAEPFVAPRTR
jgi:hypothetical protein